MITDGPIRLITREAEPMRLDPALLRVFAKVQEQNDFMLRAFSAVAFISERKRKSK
jgi:hypothetical protein